MKYVVLDENGKEYGPADEETLRKWTEAGRILPDTQVRNAMIKKWNKAKDFDFLAPAFAVQNVRRDREKSFLEKTLELLKTMVGIKKKTAVTDIKTAFRHKFIHDPAGVSLRLAAWFFDFILILVYAFLLIFVFSLSMYAGFEVNMVFNLLFIAFIGGVLFYYGILLGVFAQTVGMWFWGIMISKTDNGEVFLGRAYFFTVLMILFGIISPFVVYLNPAKRSLHEILTGTMIIKITAKPKI